MSPTPIAVRMLDRAGWSRLALGDDVLGFLGLFVSSGLVFGLFEQDGAPVLLASALVEGGFASLAGGFPEAAWFERLARDLTGAVAVGGEDRPAIAAHGGDAAWAESGEMAGLGGYRVAQGPVSGVIAQPVHRWFSLDGERVTRLVHRAGYAHRGVVGLMRGRSPRVAARFAARIAGDATVAHATAFARAAEAVGSMVVPARAAALREIMLGIERVTGDLAALGAAVEQAGDRRLAVRLGQAREAVADAVDDCFGHRLMMDIVVPGGVALDVNEAAFAPLERGLVQAALVVRRIGAARVRRDLAAAAELALGRAGSVQVLAGEIPALLAAIPAGAIAAPVPVGSGMGLGAAASARGMVHHWLDVRDGEIGDAFFIDPSARLLGRLETGVVGLDFAAAATLIACYGLSVAAIDG